jgi:hypothetical protein
VSDHLLAIGDAETTQEPSPTVSYVQEGTGMARMQIKEVRNLADLSLRIYCSGSRAALITENNNVIMIENMKTRKGGPSATGMSHNNSNNNNNNNNNAPSLLVVSSSGLVGE